MNKLKSFTIILLVILTLLMVYSVISLPFKLYRPAPLLQVIALFGFSFALVHAGQRLGWMRGLILFVFAFVVSLAYESIGSATGIIYGPYHYTDVLGPKFLGLVPYLVPVIWFMMMYPSYVIADRLAGTKLAGWKRFLLLAAIGGLVMTSWDVVIDPYMVRGGKWVWEVTGAYFGVPLQNYWGWWLTVFTAFFLYLITMRDTLTCDDKGFDRLAVFAYIVIGMGNTLVALLTGMGGPALAGFFAMTPWALMGWLATTE